MRAQSVVHPRVKNHPALRMATTASATTDLCELRKLEVSLLSLMQIQSLSIQSKAVKSGILLLNRFYNRDKKKTLRTPTKAAGERASLWSAAQR